jgi:hypothetical protein
LQAAEDKKRRDKEIAEAQKAGDLKKREADKLRKEAEEVAAVAKKQAAEEEARNRVVEDVTVRPNIPTVSGVPSRVNWRFRITDDRLVPERFWIIDEQAIGAEVRRLKDKTQIEGIEVYCE